MKFPRKKITVDIDGQEVNIFELRIGDIMEIFSSLESKKSNKAMMKQFSKRTEEFLSVSTDISMEDIRSMGPSQLMQLYDGFKEVNAAFFEIARKAGMDDILAGITNELRNSIIRDFSSSFSELSEADTAPSPSNMATRRSSLQSRNLRHLNATA